MNQIDYDNLIHYRFARRVGELHADATYACPLEGPRPGRKLSKTILVVLLVAAIGITLKVLA